MKTGVKMLAACAATFDARGTRYELALTQDPHGGVLVAWPSGAWLGMVHRDGEVLSLAGKVRKADAEVITAYLLGALDRLPWGTP